MSTSPDFYANEVLQVCNNRWFKERVVLVGDAGYCPSLMTGMGTSAALLGAYVLAGEIGKHGGENLGAAFAGYDATLRPYMTKVQRLPWTHRLYPESKAGLSIFYFLLGLAHKVGLYKLAQRRAAKESEDKWVLPLYKELRSGE